MDGFILHIYQTIFLYIFWSLSIHHPSIFLPIITHLSFCLSVSLSIYSLYLSLNLHLSIYLLIYLSSCQSTFLSVYLFVDLSLSIISLSLFLSLSPFIYIYICLSIYLSVSIHLYIYLFVCLYTPMDGNVNAFKQCSKKWQQFLRTKRDHQLHIYYLLSTRSRTRRMKKEQSAWIMDGWMIHSLIGGSGRVNWVNYPRSRSHRIAIEITVL